jgi:CheY-like chemotaxis protein
LPTILVADDNSNIQKMVALAFKSEGIDVVAVGNGEACVRKAAEITPDLVLADIFMPVRNGYEVCEFLKQSPKLSHIPVVLLAGAFDPFDEREAQRVGADGVLKKPFVPPDPLVALVKELLAKSSERLVTVSVSAQSATAPSQNTSQTPVASSSAAPASVEQSSVAQPFAPPAFVTPVPSYVEESAEGGDAEQTAVAPIRDFAIPGVEAEPVHDGGADAFGSMLEPNSLETEITPVRPFGRLETVADHESEPASAHTGFEGFTPWRSSVPESVTTEEDESAEVSNQFMPSTKDLMGRVWDVDPSLADVSPDETVIESRLEMSPLTHSTQHVTSVREESEAAVETPAAPDADAATQFDEVAEVEPAAAESRIFDWRSAFTKSPEPAADVVEATSAASMSPWSQVSSPAEAVREESSANAPSVVEHESAVEPEQIAVTASSDAPDEQSDSQLESFNSDALTNAEVEHHADVSETAASSAPTLQTETSDWISEFPQHLSPEDTTTIARSVIEELAPAAVESVATSFPVPTGAATDPRVVEDIVARVVERMQPQILEIITREVLRPVVEALVRRQLEQKLPE